MRVGVIFGGRSGEHEISLRSARSVVEAIDPARFVVTLIGIDRDGGWHVLDGERFRALTAQALPALDSGGPEVVLPPAPTTGRLLDPQRPHVALDRLDVVFPVLHGTYGEDGTVQGLLELADLPYVGAGVLGSAVGMDKDVQKRLLQAAGLPVVPFRTVTRAAWDANRDAARALVAELDWPVFVKPANLGSSVGITKVKAPAELNAAVAEAFAFDNKVVIEKSVDAREIEVAVLGNDDPAASIPGEIRPHAEFYSYEAKYIDENGAALLIPAPLDPAQTDAARAMAVQVFRVLECSGMARVDLFLERGTERFFVNEINTVPGFTSISMYPKLWEATGLPYRDLITRLLDLALERHAQRARLRTRYRPE
ncbi:D-alanine--D-alanine ligase [Candidatus Binatia bacterium]|nr:D-alanine--D-alanine ligase [Candidatus Binatia bacterium]